MAEENEEHNKDDTHKEKENEHKEEDVKHHEKEHKKEEHEPIKHHEKEHTKHHKHAKHHKKKKFKFKKYLKPAIAVIAIIVVIIIIFFAANYSGLTEKTQGNAALVNKEPISMNTLNKEYELFFQLTGYPEEYKQIVTQEKFLEQLILEKLLIQEAKKQDLLVVNKKEVDTAFSGYMYNLPFSEAEFESNLKSKDLNLEDVRNYFKRQIVLVSFLNKTLLKTVEIPDKDVEEYYNENEELFKAKEGQIRASHILVETEEEAEEIIKQLENGADFGELAKEKSIDPSAEVNSGNLGFFEKGQMVQEFEEVVFALKINEISEPVETSFGFHIIKRESDVTTFDEAKDNIRQNLLIEKQQETITDYIEELKNKAKIKIYLGDTQAETTGAVVSEPEAETQDTEPKTEVSAEESSSDNCIGKYDITPDTVIFYHADWCGYCKQMKPIVEELQSEGYNFLWSETSTGENMEVVDECFNDVIQGGVPEFICAGSTEVKVGAMPKENLKEFADECK